MISKTLNKYRALSAEVKSILGSYWVYELAEQVIVVFMGVFVYTSTESMAFMALYFLLYFTAILLGFSGWGYLTAKLQINMKWNHLRAFAAYVMGFVWLWFFREQDWHYLVFAIFNGLGLGLFWLGHHSFEMLHTNDEDRDFYSSMLGAGTHVTTILGPLLATLVFLLSDHFFGDPLHLIFFVIPVLYLLVIPTLWSLPDYVPERIQKKDWKHLRKSKDLKEGIRYAFIESFAWGPWEIFAPLLTVAALETYVNIGVFDTLLGLTAILIVLVQGHMQNKGNRVKIFRYSLVGIILYYVALYFWQWSPWIFIIAGFAWVPIQAINGTVHHVVFLKNIEQFKCEEGQFYVGMLYREFIIWLGRISSLILVGGVALVFKNDLLTVNFGISVIIFQSLLIGYYVDRVLKT